MPANLFPRHLARQDTGSDFVSSRRQDAEPLLEALRHLARSGALRSYCRSENHLWREAREVLVTRVRQGIDDPLAQHLPPANYVRRAEIPGPSIEHSAAELIAAIRTQTLAVSTLKHAASVIVGHPVEIRIGEIHTTADAMGRRVRFIPPDTVLGVLDNICRSLTAREIQDYGVLGPWAWVALTNAHAFPDGNGRLGRALCAACLAIAVPDSGPLPLNVLNHVCTEVVILSIRRAELHDNWQPLLNLLHVFAQEIERLHLS